MQCKCIYPSLLIKGSVLWTYHTEYNCFPHWRDKNVFFVGKPKGGKLKKVVEFYCKIVDQGNCNLSVYLSRFGMSWNKTIYKKLSGKTSNKTLTSLLCQGFVQGFYLQNVDSLPWLSWQTKEWQNIHFQFFLVHKFMIHVNHLFEFSQDFPLAKTMSPMFIILTCYSSTWTEDLYDCQRDPQASDLAIIRRSIVAKTRIVDNWKWLSDIKKKKQWRNERTQN